MPSLDGGRLSGARLLSATTLLLCVAIRAPAFAEPYPVAGFSGLDKVTALVTKFDVETGRPARFGALEITVRACDKKPPEEPPQTAAYVEIRQIDRDGGSVDPQPIFKGWMYAESPGLNALEHPVYDVWLNTCKTASGAVSGDSR